MTHSNKNPQEKTLPNPKTYLLNPSIKPLPQSHNCIKKFIHFVSIFPNNPNVICFIFANQNSVPHKFFSIYPAVGDDYQSFGLYYNETIINKEKTLMIGLDKSFINLANGSEKQPLTQKHLIFVYLLSKFQSVKFVLCFDKNAIKEPAFLTVKNTFNRLATSLDFEKRNGYGKSFMIFLSHSDKQDAQELEKVSQGKFRQSIKEDEFFKQNHDFPQQIINDVFKSQNRQQKRFIRFQTQFTENEVDRLREQFEKTIHLTKPLKGEEKFNIPDKLFGALKQKSSDWKPFIAEKSAQQLDRTASSNTSNKLSDKQATPLQKIFSLWENSFKNLMKLISQKLTKGKNILQQFSSNQTFLMSKSTDKFSLTFDAQRYDGNTKKQSPAYQTSYFLSSLMEFMIQNAVQYEKIRNCLVSSTLLSFFRQKLNKFLKVFYQCQLLNANNDKKVNEEKVIYDYFMVFDELAQIFGQMEDAKKKDFLFFTENELMLKPITNITEVKKLFLHSVKALNFILMREFNRIEKGDYVELECIEPFIKKIKDKMDEQLKIKSGLKIFENESLRKIIAKYEMEMFKRRTAEFSNKPLTRISFIVKVLRKEQDMLNNRSFVDMFARTCLDYIRQYKDDASLEIKQKIIQLLEFDMSANFREIGKIYQDQIDIMVQKARKESRQFKEDQRQFALQYTEFVIKLGFLEKLREKAHEISVFDKQLSKKMLCRALMRDCAKSQLEFIKSDSKFKSIPCSAQEEHQHKIQLGNVFEAIERLERYFKKDSRSEEKKKKQENQLLDI